MGTQRCLSGIFLILLFIIVPNSTNAAAEAAAQSPTGDDLRLLRVFEGVVRLFQAESDAIWPGYSLAEQPFLVYSPERWALLVNSPGTVDGFGPCPQAWPSLGTRLQYHEGRYDDLAGQLEFNVDLGGTELVAIGFPESLFEKFERPELKVFSYIVHEAFHQYQRSAFGEIPWAREEKYPITDMNNGALAWVEMRILQDALEAAAADDREGCRRCVEEFVAVRRFRWDTGDPFFHEYEQGQELEEGTAKYVELKCVESLPSVKYLSSVDGADSPLAASIPYATMPGLLLEELRERMGDTCLQPEDIPRNRIYAVAAAEGFLLDYFGIGWKTLAQRAGSGFTFVDLLGAHFDVDDSEVEDLVGGAKRRYNYDEVLAATTRAAREYREAYEREMRAFEAQSGTRVELVISSSGLSRSRVSGAKKWVMDAGRFTLCNHFEVYTLRAKDWSLELHNAGLLEINDWDSKLKTVVLYDAGVDSVAFDGEPAKVLAPGDRDFKSFELEGDRFVLEGSHPGKFVSDGAMVRFLLDRD